MEFTYRCKHIHLLVTFDANCTLYHITLSNYSIKYYTHCSSTVVIITRQIYHALFKEKIKHKDVQNTESVE